MNTAEHMIFANPDAWCSRGSPGGGTYGVLRSSDFARAISSSVVVDDCSASAVNPPRQRTIRTSKTLFIVTLRIAPTILNPNLRITTERRPCQGAAPVPAHATLP